MGVLDWIILAVVVILAVLAVRRIRKKGNNCNLHKKQIDFIAVMH